MTISREILKFRDNTLPSGDDTWLSACFHARSNFSIFQWLKNSKGELYFTAHEFYKKFYQCLLNKILLEHTLSSFIYTLSLASFLSNFCRLHDPTHSKIFIIWPFLEKNILDKNTSTQLNTLLEKKKQKAVL